MNNNIFENEICSYCRNNLTCSKDKIKYNEQDKVIYKNDYNKRLFAVYTLENKIKTLKCNNYQKGKK